jgi:hypothetical protein
MKMIKIWQYGCDTFKTLCIQHVLIRFTGCYVQLYAMCICGILTLAVAAARVTTDINSHIYIV